MSGPQESPGVLEHVGANVRHYRDLRGLSQQALADASGVSRRTIAALETGEANISLAKLAMLASVLGVDFAAIVSPPERLGSRQLDVTTWRGQKPGSHAILHTSAPATRMIELWSWTLAPGERYDAEPDPEGWSEMLFVTTGVLTLVLPGETLQLHQGQSVTFASAVHYTYANQHDELLGFVRNSVF